MPLIISANTPVVRSGGAREQTREVGGWLSANRARKGRPIGSTVEVNGRQVAVDAGLSRWLTYSEMWTIYRRTPDLRAAIDSIVRRCATWDWLINVELEPNDPKYEGAQEVAELVTRFLKAPNTDGETWQELMTKFLTDLLVFDQGVLELVKARGGTLAEIVALRGSTVSPNLKEDGRIEGYTQDYANDDGGFARTTQVDFKTDEIVYLRQFPTTAGSSGNSPIESIVDQVVTMLNSAKHLMLAYDADELPPGIIVLAGIAGKAAEKATQDLREMRGQDHKIRVITTPDPSNVGAKWVEMRHTPKDLDMRELVHDVRRTIWRVMGVQPIEMGDTDNMPRASAHVQLEVGTSQMINPLLELIEAKVNARIIPMLVQDEDIRALISFSFDREAKLSPIEQKEQATTLDLLVKGGIISRNEAREVLGRNPHEDGDILTVEGNVTPLTVKLDAGGTIDGDTGDGGDDGEDPPDDDDTPDDDAPGEPDEDDSDGIDEDDEAPGEADAEEQSQQRCIAAKASEYMSAGKDLDDAVTLAFDACVRGLEHGEDDEPVRKGAQRAHIHSAKCGCGPSSQNSWGDTADLVAREIIPAGLALVIEAERAFRAARDLPSEWQPAGIFKGKRTVNLTGLGNAISRYARDVRPMWRAARDQVLAALASAYDINRGGFDDDNRERAMQALLDSLTKLEVDWRMATGPLYTDAARIGRDAAVDFSGAQRAGEGWEDRAEVYFDVAMGYLTAPTGPIETVRRAIVSVIDSQSTRALPASQEVRIDPALEAALGDTIDEAVLLATAEAAFNGQEHRIYNWSGKLNDLSNETLLRGLDQVSEAEGIVGRVEWMAEWVYVGDNRTCPTCEREGSAGIRPLSQIPVRPGGDTECRGNCRCVLVFWTRAEVASGSAVELGPTG